jgi:hypothetical protein
MPVFVGIALKWLQSDQVRPTIAAISVWVGSASTP